MDTANAAPTGPRWKQPHGVRATLAVLVLCCVLPMAIVSALVTLQLYARERAQLIASTVARASAIVATIDAHFDGTEAALLALSTSQQLRDGKLAAFHERASEALAQIDADNLVVIDRGGALRMATSRPFGAPLPVLAQAPLLARVLATGRPAVSNLFQGPLTGMPIYAVAVPVLRDGAIVYTLNATATPARLAATLHSAALPPSWRAAIVDASGRTVARSHDAARFVGQPASAPLRARLAAGGSGSFETVSLEGIPVMAAYARSARSGWSVALGVPLAELTAGLRTTLAALVLATLAALTLCLGLAWRLGGNIARSVLALEAPALALASGARVDVPQLAIKECNALRDALAVAADRLAAVQAHARESVKQLNLAADAAHLGIWVRDLVHTDVWVSDNWRALFGFDAAVPVSVDLLLTRVHPDDRAAVARTLDHVRVHGGRYEIEYRIALPGRGQHWIASFGNAEDGPDGQPALVRGVALDITRRKQAELDMQLKQKEVTLLGRVAVLGELSGALAHELNQPLTAILSNAQAALRFLGRDTPDLDEVRAILQDIVAADQRAGEIIRRLRRLFEHGATPRQQIDGDALVTDALQLLRNELLNHGVNVVTELGGAGTVVDADLVQLQQVVINLVINACDAMAASAADTRVLCVRTQCLDDGQLQISVADRGPGIAADIVERLFEPFVTTKARGMGLGLSISRNIVLAHGGALWAANNPDGGATFYLTLPGVPA